MKRNEMRAIIRKGLKYEEAIAVKNRVDYVLREKIGCLGDWDDLDKFLEAFSSEAQSIAFCKRSSYNLGYMTDEQKEEVYKKYRSLYDAIMNYRYIIGTVEVNLPSTRSLVSKIQDFNKMSL